MILQILTLLGAVTLFLFGLSLLSGGLQKVACARRWMEEFGIADLAERPFLQLSSGEQRLCLVTRAFVKDPPLYVLDEPLHHRCTTIFQRNRPVFVPSSQSL